MAVIRRGLFERGFAYSTELTSYEDWLLYLELHQAGHYGARHPRAPDPATACATSR